jgi:hypothetical protein
MTALKSISLAAALAVAPLAAMAEFAPIKSKSEFLQKISGKNLTMLGIKVQVTPNGKIAGNAMGWDVMGSWKWAGGYFCRDLAWGGDDLGYNCQAVSVSGNKIRFQSDKGTGQSADLRIR